MKHPLLCGVLLAMALYLPVSSKECTRTCSMAACVAKPAVAKLPAVAKDNVADLPVSPFSRLLFNL